MRAKKAKALKRIAVQSVFLRKGNITEVGALYKKLKSIKTKTPITGLLNTNQSKF
jgi:hypothetical protein